MTNNSILEQPEKNHSATELSANNLFLTSFSGYLIHCNVK